MSSSAGVECGQIIINNTVYMVVITTTTTTTIANGPQTAANGPVTITNGSPTPGKSPKSGKKPAHRKIRHKRATARKSSVHSLTHDYYKHLVRIFLVRDRGVQ